MLRETTPEGPRTPTSSPIFAWPVALSRIVFCDRQPHTFWHSRWHSAGFRHCGPLLLLDPFTGDSSFVAPTRTCYHNRPGALKLEHSCRLHC